MIKRSTLIEMLVLVTAAVILLMALLSFNVNAQELASAASTATLIHRTPWKNIAGITYTIAIDKVPGLQWFSTPDSKTADGAGAKKFLSEIHDLIYKLMTKYIIGSDQKEIVY